MGWEWGAVVEALTLPKLGVVGFYMLFQATSDHFTSFQRRFLDRHTHPRACL